MNETDKLMRLAELAIETENLETGDNAREISIGDILTIDGKEAYAFTKSSVVFWDGTRKSFSSLNNEDVAAIYQAISDEYGVEV